MAGGVQMFSDTYAPYFQPDPGVTDFLSVKNTPLQKFDGSDTTEYYIDGQTTYNPQNPALGGVFYWANKGVMTRYFVIPCLLDSHPCKPTRPLPC